MSNCIYGMLIIYERLFKNYDTTIHNFINYILNNFIFFYFFFEKKMQLH